MLGYGNQRVSLTPRVSHTVTTALTSAVDSANLTINFNTSAEAVAFTTGLQLTAGETTQNLLLTRGTSFVFIRSGVTVTSTGSTASFDGDFQDLGGTGFVGQSGDIRVSFILDGDLELAGLTYDAETHTLTSSGGSMPTLRWENWDNSIGYTNNRFIWFQLTDDDPGSVYRLRNDRTSFNIEPDLDPLDYVEQVLLTANAFVYTTIETDGTVSNGNIGFNNNNRKCFADGNIME